MADALGRMNGESVGQGKMETAFRVVDQRMGRNIGARWQPPFIPDAAGEGAPYPFDQQEENYQQQEPDQKPHSSPPLLGLPGSGKIDDCA